MGGVPHTSTRTKKPSKRGGVSGPSLIKFLAKMATPPPSKKAKYQCRFLSKWIEDYPGIGKSFKGIVHINTHIICI